jgi:hypothetical protein
MAQTHLYITLAALVAEEVFPTPLLPAMAAMAESLAAVVVVAPLLLDRLILALAVTVLEAMPASPHTSERRYDARTIPYPS